ncbi:hypothetical protein BGW36DRAFT_265117, partial [Talaromyces proteolyticus]
ATLSLLASVVSAGPILRTRDVSTSINTTSWPVSNFDVGCSPEACEYAFTVTRPAGPNNPGFNTSCTGSDYKIEWQACDDKSVVAKLIPRTYPLWEVNVKHSFASGSSNVDAFANGT